jgi:hypothetical protein
MYECPNECGSQKFYQIVEQSEVVDVGEGGEVEYIEPDGHYVETKRIECAECGAEVMGETDD